MQGSLEAFLEDVAQRGSWVGGGSVAALSVALSAALLQKLVTRPELIRRLQRVRRECVRLIPRDAKTFARVIQATRGHRRAVFERALKTATDVPCQVHEHAETILAAGRRAQRDIKPRFQSDLKCAMAMAFAGQTAARALIDTNLEWLHDVVYTRNTQQRLRAFARRHVC